MGKKQRNDTKKKQTKPVQQDFIAYFKAVKEASVRFGAIRFVIEDDFGTKIRVRIEDKKTTIGGKEVADEQARELIVQAQSDFERLFLEAVRPNDPEKNVIPMISLAKMTDEAGKAKAPVVMDISDGTKNNVLKIERISGTGVYHLNERNIDFDHAELFVRKHYNAFLLGMKDAIKKAKERRPVMSYDTVFGENKTPKKETTIENGKITVDISGYFARRGGSRKKQASKSKQKQVMLVRDAILNNGRKKGYVEA